MGFLRAVEIYDATIREQFLGVSFRTKSSVVADLFTALVRVKESKKLSQTFFTQCGNQSCNNPVASASSLAFPDGSCVDFLPAV